MAADGLSESFISERSFPIQLYRNQRSPASEIWSLCFQVSLAETCLTILQEALAQLVHTIQHKVVVARNLAMEAQGDLEVGPRLA